jgi:protein-S-isoprenylcysteine O-methyltransferase Ste14
MKSILKVTIASVVFGIVHSALASLRAKQLAAKLFGERRANGLYRLFFGLQSIALLFAYNRYVLHLPAVAVYTVRGPLAWLIRVAWLANAVCIYTYFRHAGFARMLGLEDITAVARGQSEAPTVDAQGPSLGTDGKLRISGPFRWTRHPVNFLGLPALWLKTSMSVNELVACIWLTIYLVLGSLREETRRRIVYGQAYEEYRRSGVSFFVPLPPRVGRRQPERETTEADVDHGQDG